MGFIILLFLKEVRWCKDEYMFFLNPIYFLGSSGDSGVEYFLGIMVFVLIGVFINFVGLSIFYYSLVFLVFG